MKLYRAAKRGVIGPSTFGLGACFAERREDAAAYLDNPGFGGAHLFCFEVRPEYVLHLGRGPGAALMLATELDFDDPVETAEHWQSYRGLIEVFEILENVGGIQARIPSRFDWLVYDEPGVAARRDHLCTTWRYYGSTPLVGRLC